MPPEPLPWDRFKERRYDRPPPDGAGPGARWRDASPHNGFRGRLPGNGRPVPWRYHSAESGRGFTPSRVNDKFIGDDGFRSPGYRMDGRYNRFNRDSSKGPFGHRDTRGHTWENDMSPNSSGRPYFGNDQRSDDDRGSFVPKDLRDHCWENGRLQNGSDQRSLDEKGAFGRREMRGKYWENGNVQSSADDRAPYEKKGLKRRFSPENGGLSNSSGRTHISNDQRPVDDKGSSGQRNMRGKSCENGALLNSSSVDKDIKNRSEEKGVVPNSSDKVQSGSDQTPSENLHIFTSPTHSEQSKDQCDKSSGANDVVLGRKVENENSLVSIDWKPIKWSRSGSLSSRGSLKSPDSAEPKTEMPPHNATPLRSPSGDAAVTCATVSAVSSEEGGSKKKPRLGWGEGLAKFEKKKVEGPDEDSATKPGLVVSVSGEPSQVSNLADKSPSVAGFLECASPVTPSSAACRFSPGVDDKACVGSANLDCDTNLSGSPNLLLQENTEGNQETEFCLENVDHISVANISSSLTELLQLEDPAMVESNFVRSTAMNKLLVWRGEALKALEVTESEIDSFENDLKKLISESASISSSLVEAQGEVRNEYVKTPLGEVKGNMNIDVVENLEKSPIYVIDDGNIEGPSSSEGSGHLVATTLTSDSPEALCDRILATNKETAIKAYETFSSHCNIQTLGTRTVSSWKSNPRIMEKFAFKKRCRKFQERVNILKYKALQHLWKEDLQLMSLKKNNPKSHKRLEIGLRGQHGSNKKHRSFRSRVSNAAGNLSLVPTDSAIDFTSKLLSEAQVKPYRNSLKMPALIMNKEELMTSRFISNNGLVEDPCAVEKERKIINPWTQEEKDLFMDKFATFGKDFNKISSFLDHKTTADCVEFYYKNHKSDCFVKLKKKPDLAKQGKSYSFNNYLVGSGKRRDRETNAASLDVLGEASEIAANAENAITENRQEIEAVNEREIEAVNDRETEAADVLAGICGSISSEAMGSCVTSSFDRVENYKDLANQGLSEDDMSCSDDDCLEEMEPRAWTDEEKSILIEAFTAYGNDFIMISRRVGTKSRDQCKLFFSKARKRFGLNSIRPRACAEGEDDNNGGGSDVEGGACVVEGNSAVSSDKSSSKVDKDVVLFDADMNNAEKSGSKEPVESGSSEKSTSKVDKDAMLSDVDMNNVEKSVSKEPVESVSSEKSTSKVDKDATRSDADIRDLEKNAGKDCDESEKILIDDLAEEDKAEVGHECDVKTDNGVENTLLQPDIEEGGRTIGEKISPVGSVSADVALAQEQEMVVENNLNNEDKEENLNDKQHQEIGNFVQDLNHAQDLSSETASKVAEASSGACVDLGVDIRQEQRILFDLNPPLDVGYKFDMIARKLYNKSDNVNTCTQHESGSSGVLVGYPLQVPVNRELNADMYTSHGSFLSRCSGSDAPITPSSGLEFPFRFQEPKKSHLRHNSWSSSDTEKPKSKGDVKLFGQILKLKESKNSTNNVDSDLGKVNRNNYLGLENVPSRSCGVWDDNRSVPSVPNSAILLAKYPAAFGNFSSTSNIEHQQQVLQSVVKSKNNDLNLNGVSVFPPREITNANGVVDYQLYMNQQDLISEMQRRNAIGAFSSLRNPIGANVGISDPVAAIKMHYAKVDQYANNVVIEEESWRGQADLGR